MAKKTAEITALRAISRAIGQALDLDSTLHLITRTTADVLGMDSCSLYLLDPAGEYLVLKATTGLATEAVGLARLAARTLKPSLALGLAVSLLFVSAAVAYSWTLGIAFYAWQRRFHHFVWHLFVLAGSVLHYLAVYFFVIPRPA